MSQTARYHETLRRLAMIDEGFVEDEDEDEDEDEAGLGLDLARTSAPPGHHPVPPAGGCPKAGVTLLAPEPVSGAALPVLLPRALRALTLRQTRPGTARTPF